MPPQKIFDLAPSPAAQSVSGPAVRAVWVSAMPPPEPDARIPGAPPLLGEKIRLLTLGLRAHAKALDQPRADVAVIIPVYNQLHLTLDCLQSILNEFDEALTLQLIIIDDASPEDEVAQTFSRLPHITYLRNGSNQGFLRSCNKAAALANASFLHFLNNDTIVTKRWLSELVGLAHRRPDAGAFGSRLMFPDGSLQEAGGIIWRDGSGWNYGRGGDPNAPQYNYVREVDYCSAASLLVRAEVFWSLGGFNDLYAPAYFEDTDLCFAIRNSGMPVLYQPKSVVIHLDGASSGQSTESGVKRNQVLNRPKFTKRWHEALAQHYEPDGTSGIRAARRLQPPLTLVMIDNYVPEYDKDSGSNRLFNIIKQFQLLEVSVIYVPDNYARSEPYTSVLQHMGVEVLYGTSAGVPFDVALRERLEIADIAWIGRPDIASKIMPIVREYPDIPVIYDTIDLHHVRAKRELELAGVVERGAWDDWQRLRDLELNVIRAADISITVTDVEREYLEAEGIDGVFVVPNVHEVIPRELPYEQTSGLLFIGSYVHTPNVDAVLWLCAEIMPIIWKQNPTINLTLLGSNPPPAVKNLASDRVSVPGYTSDVSSYFEEARVFIAPLRYGAGLKGKVGQAFSFGVPTVTTSIGAEGFSLCDGRDALVRDDAISFARAILAVHDDRRVWDRLSTNGMEVVRRFSPAETRTRLLEAVMRARRRRAYLKPIAAEV